MTYLKLEIQYDYSVYLDFRPIMNENPLKGNTLAFSVQFSLSNNY